MVVTMGGLGAVYAQHDGACGVVPAKKVDVIDTTRTLAVAVNLSAGVF